MFLFKLHYQVFNGMWRFFFKKNGFSNRGFTKDVRYEDKITRPGETTEKLNVRLFFKLKN